MDLNIEIKINLSSQQLIPLPHPAPPFSFPWHWPCCAELLLLHTAAFKQTWSPALAKASLAQPLPHLPSQPSTEAPLSRVRLFLLDNHFYF